MNTLVVLGIIGAMVALRFLKPNIIVWAIAWWIAVYAMSTYGIDPPVPASVVNMFMGIVTIALAAYITAADGRMREAATNTIAFFTEKKFTIPLVILLLAVPALVAFNVYSDMTAEPAPPVAGRTIHPPPPATVSYQGRTINMVTDDNPYRTLETSDPAAFAAHVDNGRRVYYENCVFCHGDNMEGDGVFAHGYEPIPANFQDVSTIAMLQENYLFWRIAKGGPGLPVESTPWSSAMPAWELFLTEEEIWDVILFLYDYTGHRPRALEVHE
ncbi:MAG: cytochrome c [Rhodothermales bacterium]|nr:cytochrome c [Rhodothermales bacterium]MBO6778133.1 cytochrome c [Rhodothermales bacterium]